MIFASSPLGAFEMDALREVGNVGAGHAAKALAELLGRRVDLSVPRVSLVPVEAGGGQEGVAAAAVLLSLAGGLEGRALVFFPLEGARRLLALLPVKGAVAVENASDLTPFEVSALREIASILAGSYLTALAGFVGLRASHGVPDLVVDFTEAVWQSLLASLAEKRMERALLIETVFHEGNDSLMVSFYLLPDPSSLDRLVSACRGSLGEGPHG